MENLKIARKSLVAKKSIKINEIFSEENLCVKRRNWNISYGMG